MSESPSTGPSNIAAEHVALFERARPRLVGLAYRITGSLVDGEDVVSEVWLRWAETEHEHIGRPEAWLTTVTTRRAIDWARAAARRRETYLGPWLPEPVVTAWSVDADPATAAELGESLSLAFLTVLDRLDPTSRAVFLLADIWGWSFAEVALAVGRSETGCRQLASRARRRLRAAPQNSCKPDSNVTRAEDRGVVDSLVSALATRNLKTTLELLAPGVVLVSDGGPTIHAARRPIISAERVATFLLNLTRRLPSQSSEVVPVMVNGTPGIVVRSSSTPDTVMAFDLEEGRVQRIWVVLAPEKLRRLANPPNLR